MVELVGELRRPLPKGDLKEYARRRLVEALVEAVLALDFLRDGFDRDAAGKAFQAWKALLAAYAAAEREGLAQLAKKGDLLEEWAILVMPTGGMARVAQLLERAGHGGISPWTEKALGLHRYRYNGLDPGGGLSPYRDPETAAESVLELARGLREYVVRLRQAWSEAAERALKELEERLGSGRPSE